ncbi:MAG: MBL fold metallo-hydrolase RNA specificity domain-containing protein [Gemmatimonadota bacterium]
MEVEFWGAAREVTGSMHLLHVGGRQVLLDCGLFQGRRKQAFERNRNLPFDPAGIDAVVLSHAHADHCGNLPTLVRGGFRGEIHCTAATRDLCEYMLMDSAHIQKNDVRYVNKRRRREGRKPFEPLYGPSDARAALRRFRAVDYGAGFDVVPGVRARFLDAGHILGSAVTVLDLEEDGRRVRLAFSGDLGRRGLPILRDPEAPEGADYVIMESTYGNRTHPPASAAREFLRECSQRTWEKKAKLIVPAFALGRTQELVYRLNQLWEEDELPRIDVFVDSPLAVNVTDVFRRHPECYDEEMLETLRTDSDGDPLGFECLRYIRKVEESKALNRFEGSAVIISASGMCEAGRILHHLLNHIENPDNTVLFAGYQAQHTLGRRLLEGKSPVSILGHRREVRARIERADSYSAHADREGLLDWAGHTCDRGRVGRIFVVHGEEESARALASGLGERCGARVEIPERGQAFEL